VAPFTQYSLRLRDQYVARPVVSVRCSASSFIHASMSTSPVACSRTIAGTRPSVVRFSRAAMVGSSWDFARSGTGTAQFCPIASQVHDPVIGAGQGVCRAAEDGTVRRAPHLPPGAPPALTFAGCAASRRES
jgi:hypothetical protein